MNVAQLSLAELFDLKSAVNSELNRRISLAADDFLWSLCAYYGVDYTAFRGATRRQYSDIKRIASYYFVAMKGLSSGEAAELIGINRVTVGQHVKRVLFFKKNVPGKWFKIFNIIQSTTK